MDPARPQLNQTNNLPKFSSRFMFKPGRALDDSTVHYPGLNFTLQPGFPGWCLWPQMTKFESCAVHLLEGSQSSQTDQVLFRLFLNSTWRQQLVTQAPGLGLLRGSYQLRTQLNKAIPGQLMKWSMECGKCTEETVETRAPLSLTSLWPWPWAWEPLHWTKDVKFRCQIPFSSCISQVNGCFRIDYFKINETSGSPWTGFIFILFYEWVHLLTPSGTCQSSKSKQG